MFTVVVTVEDKEGRVATDTIQVNVVFGSCPTLPDMTSPSRDLDGDGRCEDLNGNGRLDFGDIVGLFQQMDSEVVQANQAKFDFNLNGRVDLDDVLDLFSMIIVIS